MKKIAVAVACVWIMMLITLAAMSSSPAVSKQQILISKSPAALSKSIMELKKYGYTVKSITAQAIASGSGCNCGQRGDVIVIMEKTN